MAGLFKHLAAELRSLRRASKGAATLDSGPLVERLPAIAGPAPLIGEVLPPELAAPAEDTPPPWTPSFIDYNRQKPGGILNQFSVPLAINNDDDPPGWTSNIEENYQALLTAHEHSEKTGEPQVIPVLKLVRRPPGPG